MFRYLQGHRMGGMKTYKSTADCVKKVCVFLQYSTVIVKYDTSLIEFVSFCMPLYKPS